MQLIKIITGIRRCGKSTLLKLYRDELIASGVDENQITFVNLEEKENASLKQVDALYDYLKGRLVAGKMKYIFIDEVQQCVNFQIAVDSLFVKDNVDIYVIGSNAHMLFGGLATLLSGRYVTIKVLPLSFDEYLTGVGNDNLEHEFRDYLRFGSFPFILQFNGNEEQIRNYLELIRRGYGVFIGKVNNSEIDFVGFKGSETIDIQVAESIKEGATFECEMKPLRMIKDYNRRVAITTDCDVNESYDGIKHIKIWDFLLNKRDI